MKFAGLGVIQGYKSRRYDDSGINFEVVFNKQTIQDQHFNDGSNHHKTFK